jgi:ribosome assembly protein SQT1
MMAVSTSPEGGDDNLEDDDALIDIDEAADEIVHDSDHPMDSEGDDSDSDAHERDQEIQLQNDSKAHFDLHQNSIFSIAQHPRDSALIATGAGDDTAYIFRTDPAPPLQADPSAGRPSLPPVAKLPGHTDSVNALAFSLPDGAYLVTGGLDGRLRVHSTTDEQYPLLAEAHEVPEINFIVSCPHPSRPNTIAIGASDGSVWVYTIDATDKAAPLQIVQAYYLHTESCSAGAWTPDGVLLATISEDGSLYVWDVFGEAAAAGVIDPQSQSVVGLTAEDQRFAVEGGLYSVAIAPNGTFAAVGGAGGMIRAVGLPRLKSPLSTSTQGQKGRGSNKLSSSGKHASGAEVSNSGSAGQILASLQVQIDSVESLSFSSPPLTLLAAGSVDGSIVLFDTAHRFTVRRHIREAHDGYAVVRVAFSTEPGKQHLLTSCGMDGVVRRFDTRGGTAASGQGLIKEWRGHRGEGEGGGVLGFVQEGGRVVTAGDDGICLVFED